jgi:hypothetical protein
VVTQCKIRSESDFAPKWGQTVFWPPWRFRQPRTPQAPAAAPPQCCVEASPTSSLSAQRCGASSSTPAALQHVGFRFKVALHTHSSPETARHRNTSVGHDKAVWGFAQSVVETTDGSDAAAPEDNSIQCDNRYSKKQMPDTVFTETKRCTENKMTRILIEEGLLVSAFEGGERDFCQSCRKKLVPNLTLLSYYSHITLTLLSCCASTPLRLT